MSTSNPSSVGDEAEAILPFLQSELEVIVIDSDDEESPVAASRQFGLPSEWTIDQYYDEEDPYPHVSPIRPSPKLEDSMPAVVYSPTSPFPKRPTFEVDVSTPVRELVMNYWPTAKELPDAPIDLNVTTWTHVPGSIVRNLNFPVFLEYFEVILLV